MVNTIHKIKSLYPLSEQSVSGLINLTTKIAIPKGSIIIHQGHVEKCMYFIEEGLVRAYSDGAEKQVTFWFGMPGDYIISAQSFVHNKPGYESMEALEDCILYEINTAEFHTLLKDNAELANWSRKLAENEFLKLEKMFISRQFKTATQVYVELLEQIPSLPNRVPLKHIASFLGISQVSLSRIRTGLAKGII